MINKKSGLEQSETRDKWKETIPKISGEIFDIALALGGQITGEHGVGATRSKYLEKAVGPKTLKLFRGIKHLFDPNNILNPGKILPE